MGSRVRVPYAPPAYQGRRKRLASGGPFLRGARREPLSGGRAVRLRRVKAAEGRPAADCRWGGVCVPGGTGGRSRTGGGAAGPAAFRGTADMDMGLPVPDEAGRDAAGAFRWRGRGRHSASAFAGRGVRAGFPREPVLPPFAAVAASRPLSLTGLHADERLSVLVLPFREGLLTGGPPSPCRKPACPSVLAGAGTREETPSRDAPQAWESFG